LEDPDVSSRIDAVASIVLALSAVFVAGTYAYKSFWSSGQSRAGAPQAATRMKRWPEAVALGREIAGNAGAENTMVVFGDLQCPACRGFHTGTLARVIAEHPSDLRVMFIRFPLSYHRFAMPAAQAAECVNGPTALRRWMDAVYDKQDSLGIKSWGALAAEAGVSDTIALTSCMRRKGPFERIEASQRFGNEINLRGTPTIAINGWLLPYTPTVTQIDSILARPHAG
jgi:protein-disulfide isomerase